MLYLSYYLDVMIPKTIHYCWFGKNPKNEEITKCIASWKEHCPDFTIKEWNENNFDIESNPFTMKMYAQQKWAFVADYVRLHALVLEGGFYLDTDMLLVKSLSDFTSDSCVLGEEAVGIISAGMIGAMANHPYIENCKHFYDTSTDDLMTIPRILTNVFNNHNTEDKIRVLPPRTFYPFDASHINQYHGQPLGDDVYGVHLWHYSWGHPLNKAFKGFGIYSFGKRVTEILGIKEVLKRLFGFV